MTAKEFIASIGPIDPQETSAMFFYLAEHVREAQLADGRHLCLIADFSDWLRELAEAAIARAVARNPQMVVTRPAARSTDRTCPRCGHVHQSAQECEADLGGGRVCRCEMVMPV
jgi:hypothetical protein